MPDPFWTLATESGDPLREAKQHAHGLRGAKRRVQGPREAEGPSDACRGLREAEESAGERGGVEWAEVVEGLSYANQFDWHAKFVRDRECDAALGRAV